MRTGWFLAVVVAATVLGSVTPVSADSAEVPPTLTVPNPHVGDIAAYNLTTYQLVDGHAQKVQDSHPIVTFERLGTARVADEAGLVHTANAIKITNAWAFHSAKTDPLTWTERTIIRYEDAADGAFVATALPYAYTADVGSYLVSSSGSTWYYQEGWDHKRPCGLTNPMQGRTSDLTQSVDPLGPDCFGAGAFSDRGPFDAVATDTLAGANAIRFSGGQKNTAWMSDKVPYPVRFVQDISGYFRDFGDNGTFIEWPADTFQVIDLVSFKAGATALPSAASVPAPTALPALTFEPASRWGPSDPPWAIWPLSAAISLAKADTDIKAFLDSHPDAYVADATSRHETAHQAQPGRVATIVTDGWSLELDDGKEKVRVWASRTTTDEDAAALPAQSPLHAASTSTEVQCDCAAMHSFRAPWSQLSTQWPTAASAAERWRSYAGASHRDVSPNHYGIYVSSCLPYCDDGVYILAGQTDWTTWGNSTAPALTGAPPSATNGRTLDSELAFASGGKAAYLNELDLSSTFQVIDTSHASASPSFTQPLAGLLAAVKETQRTIASASKATVDVGTALPPRPTLPGGGNNVPDQASAPGVTPAGNQVQPGPTPNGNAAVLAVTLVTVAAAGAAALWWAAAAGLFSRIRNDAAPDHPVRALLLQLIEAAPGIHLRELMRRSGKEAGAVRHHLSKLIAADLIVAHASSGYTCYFRKGRTDRRIMATSALLRSPSARLILAAARGGAVAATHVQATAGLSAGTVEYHVRRLADAGLLQAQVVGHRMMLTATAAGLASLDSMGGDQPAAQA